MGDDLAAANVNRSYSLAATSIAIFTFSMIFMYPRYVSGDISPVGFQVSLVVMGIATFSFVFSSFMYYAVGMRDRMSEDERLQLARRGDLSWLLGYSLLFAVPSLVLFTVRLPVVGAIWGAMWLVYIVFVIRNFPRVFTRR
jgi:hypothetical protein